MENRPIGPEEQDDTSDLASTKKKRGSTLSRYLSALRGKEVGADDSLEASTEKPKRVQQLFKRLFPGIVERPTHLSVEETNPQEYDFNHEAWFGWARQSRQGEITQPATEQEVRTTLAEVDDQIETDDTEVVDTIDQPAAIIEEVPEVREESPVVSDEALNESTVVDSRLKLPEQHIPATTEPRQQGEIPLRPSTEAEIIIERRGTNLLPIALVGAEYIGRKRADKKLESRVDKKIDASSEKQVRGEALQKELERVVAQNKQQVEKLKEARDNIERKVSEKADRREIIQKVIPAAELKPVSQELRKPEQSSSPEEVIKPLNIAEKVADAAEHDVPVERAFERSHEVKDDRSVSTGAAASVGAVIAANAAATSIASIPQVANSKSAPSDKNLPFVSDADIAAAYKQAAKAGFWTAICVIVLGVIAYLMIRYI